MKKLISTLLSLLVIGLMFGSITQSPNGYNYLYTYNNAQYTNFSIVNRDAISLSYGETDIVYSQNVDTIVNVSADNTQIPIAISLPQYPAGAYRFNISIDNQRFENQSIRTWSNTPLQFMTPILSYGVYNLTIDVIDTADSTIVSDEICFAVMDRDTVYHNLHGDELIVKQTGISNLNAIKPVMFVEGFDINIDSSSSFMSSLVAKWLPSLPNSEVYLLKLAEGTRNMRDNAMVVLAALRYIHDKQSTTRLVEGTKVFGYSMGGVLARYALAFAEDNNVEHYCSQYISLDAPHRGVALNQNVQHLVDHLKDALNDVHNHNADAWKDKVQSTTAKQLLRANYFASGFVNNNEIYTTGTTDYNDFYSEINQEERNSYLPENPVLNTGAKTGFPYKQNNIKCLAFSNGSLERSGTFNLGSACMDYNFNIHFTNIWDSSFTADQCDYDYQPGSVFNDIRELDMCHESQDVWMGFRPPYSFDLNQYSAPVLVPTKSSLYLKEINVNNPSNTDPQFAINNYNNISANDADLHSHSYFDKLVYPTPASGTDSPTWNWKHGELDKSYVQTGITSSATWMNNQVNETIGLISGTVSDPNPSSVTLKMFVNGLLYNTSMVNSDGSYTLPYIYTRGSNVRLIFSKANCMPTYRDIVVNYVLGEITYLPITPVTVYSVNLNNILVSQSQQGSFQSVSAAVDYLQDLMANNLYSGQAIKIRVLAGTATATYTEDINLSPLIGYPIPSFTLEGIGDVIINGGITLEGGALYGDIISNYTIKRLSVTNATQGIRYIDTECFNYDNTARIKLNVQNCHIYGCGIYGGDTFSLNGYSGGGVCFEGAGSITGTLFENNKMLYGPSWGNFNKAGAIFVNNCTNLPVEIKNNTFNNNQGAVGGAVVLTGSGETLMSNNSFSNNGDFGNTNGLACRSAKDLSVYNAYNTHVNNNLFVTNSANASSGVSVALVSYSELDSGFLATDVQPIEFYNNTIVNSLPYTSTSPALVFKDRWGGNAISQMINISNNIFSYTMGTGRVESLNNGSPSVSYNVFYNTNPLGFQLSPTACNKIGDPQLDADFVPLWDATTMSPCIDSGDPSLFDDDGSPSDIGANPSIAHKYESYTMPTGNASNSIKWMSFPVLNRTTSGYTTNSNFFAPIIYPNILGYVEWKERDYNKSTMYIGQQGLEGGNASVNSYIGFRINLLAGAPEQILINTPGFIQPPNTVLNLYAHLAGTTEKNENWLGYYLPQSVEPFVALSPIMNYVTAIKTQRWSMKKSPVDGIWLTSTVNPTINYGDMVIVCVTQDCSFSWNNSHPVDPRLRAVAVKFSYTEKMDYTPLYINLEALAELPKEIGVYVDGACKGAVTVEGSNTDLCAYLDEGEIITAENCEFVLYYDSKSLVDNKQSCKLAHDAIQKINDNGMQYYTMNINSTSVLNPVIPVTALQQNYPNPFNPETTISFEIAEEGMVNLEIFNIKGQLVKTLFSGNKVSGPHRIVWNGTDKYGRNVASGLYHYRLTTKDGNISKKMLLLK
ncbi:MAG: T9SS type A sorting domain-containing protein [Candidatus Cloacimonetes bacterium]|nr:T9SS type A sorting domain-containing protein [Candidatus Cloacimonadota bacterium]